MRVLRVLVAVAPTWCLAFGLIAAMPTLVTAPASAKSKATIAKDARLAGDRERTRFIADLSKKVDVHVYALGSPYRVIVDAAEAHSAAALFGALRELFDSCFCFCCGTPEAAFIGASPELLVRRDGAGASTVALAGSARRSADPAVDDDDPAMGPVAGAPDQMRHRRPEPDHVRTGVPHLSDQLRAHLSGADRVEQDPAFDAGPSALARGIVFVPALSGLGCPYWDRAAAGLWIGLGLDTQRGDLCRAVLEGIALRSAAKPRLHWLSCSRFIGEP